MLERKHYSLLGTVALLALSSCQGSRVQTRAKSEKRDKPHMASASRGEAPSVSATGSTVHNPALGTLLWSGFGRPLSAQPGGVPFANVRGVPAVVIGTSTTQGERWLQLVDAAGIMGWSRDWEGAVVTSAQVLAPALLEHDPPIDLDSPPPGYTGASAPAFTMIAAGRIIDATEERFLESFADQGMDTTTDPIGVPWLQVESSGQNGWLSLISANVWYEKAQASGRNLLPVGLVRRQLGFLGTENGVPRFTYRFENPKELLFLEPTRPGRPLKVSDELECGNESAVYFDPKGSAAQLVVATCYNPDSELEAFDAVFEVSSGRGYLFAPNDSLRLVRVASPQWAHGSWVLDLGVRSSHHYHRGLLVIPPAGRGVRWLPLPQSERFEITWQIDRVSNQLIVSNTTPDDKATLIEYWALGAGHRRSAGVFSIIKEFSDYGSAQEALMDNDEAFVMAWPNRTWALVLPHQAGPNVCKKKNPGPIMVTSSKVAPCSDSMRGRQQKH